MTDFKVVSLDLQWGEIIGGKMGSPEILAEKI